MTKKIPALLALIAGLGVVSEGTMAAGKSANELRFEALKEEHLSMSKTDPRYIPVAQEMSAAFIEVARERRIAAGLPTPSLEEAQAKMAAEWWLTHDGPPAAPLMG
jgi:hypothetical protein